MTTVLFIVRHGESEANAEQQLHGFSRSNKPNTDIELNSIGYEQAKTAGESLADHIADLNNINTDVNLISSPFIRASQTAEVIQRHLRVRWLTPNLTTDILLSEQSCGLADGNLQSIWKYCERNFSENALRMAVGDMHYQPPRGESFMDVYVRSCLFLERKQWFSNRLANVVVSHKSTCLMLHGALTGELNLQDEWKNCEIRKYVINSTEKKATYVQIHGCYPGEIGF